MTTTIADLECPYCGAEVNTADVPVGDAVFFCGCGCCGNEFRLDIEWEPLATVSKADCLNGGGHDYRKMSGDDTEARYECMGCGATKWMNG